MNFVYNGLRYTKKITEEQYQKWGKFYNFKAQCLLWSCVIDFLPSSGWQQKSNIK